MRGTLWRWINVLLLAALAAGSVPARAGTVEVGNNDSYVLSSAFSVYEDPGAKLGLDAILAPALQAQFKPVDPSARSTNFGATNGAVWLRVVLRTEAGAPSRWMLEIANPPLDRIDLYTSNPQGGFDHQSGGDSLPFAQRSVPHRNHVKPVELAANSETILYLRVMSQGTVSVPSTLWQPAALWHSDQRTYSIFSLYFGQLLGLIFYNLMLFLSVRDRAYLAYVAFATSVGLSQLASTGLGAQFLWPGILWLNDVATNASYAASGLFGLLFVRDFLACRAQQPGLDRVLRLQLLSWLVTVGLAFTLPHRWIVWAVTVLALTSAVTVLVAGCTSIRRHHPGAKYFGLAWIAFLLGIFVLTAHNYGLLPSNLLTINALLLGSALEMVLLSFALADRINVARREKELAQAHVISEQATVQALQQSQHRYQSVIEHVGEGMAVLQNDAVVFVNFRATEILEATKATIISNGLLAFIHEDDQAALAERLRLRRQGQHVPHYRQIFRASVGGSWKWLEWGENLVPWDAGQGLLVFFLDVTQRYNAELETRAAVERQNKLHELRSRFIAMTSHEFRTPLAAILSAQDLLQTYGERIVPEEKSELFDMIRTSVNRMTQMLERVLLLGQAEAHLLAFKPQPLDLAALCRQLIVDAKRLQPDMPCEVLLDFADGVDGRRFDASLLRHILGNLLSNAIKYSPKGSTVRLAVYPQGPATVFKVSDNGMGIPRAEIGDLFASFHRASNVGAIAGTGLGLAIVKQSVELHGGSISVDSHEGQGTIFTVQLEEAVPA